MGARRDACCKRGIFSTTSTGNWRLRGTASLDGVELDHLMHHAINLLVPTGGAGQFVATGNPIWAFGGAVWAMSLVLLSARHDARYKAFVQRLKRVRGKLEVRGGGAGGLNRSRRFSGWLRRARGWLASRRRCTL